jgi:hypothetical protein
MQLLQDQQLWELTRSRQLELIQEAEKVRLARMVQQPQQNWWSSLLRRKPQSPAIPLEANITPELG